MTRHSANVIPGEFDQSVPECVGPAPDAKRRKLTLTDKLAATYLKMTTFVDTEAGLMVPVICPEWAKTRTAKEIVTVFDRWREWDHAIALGIGGTNHPANLFPLTKHEHQTVKTPADRPKIDKTRRLTEAQEAFRSLLLAKTGRAERVQVPRKSKPMPGTKASGWRHRVNGIWERREKP